MNATAQPDFAERLDALDRKLDLVLAEVDEVRRIRREVEELKDDLARVGKDVFRTAVAEMEEVAPFVGTGDLSALFKRLVRNVNNLNGLLVQLEGARDLLHDATPLVRQLVRDGMEHLDALDRKGYFVMGRELGRALDNVVSSFTVDEVRLLADNLVAILQTVKNLTQPEMLQAINHAVAAYQQIDSAKVQEYSLWRAFREINQPETRRGLGFLIAFLHNFGASLPATPCPPAAPPPPPPQISTSP
jgi:uncharacterized protein YjgD (DUF1641 family)